MKRKQTVATFLFGMLMGGVLFGGGAAVAAGIVATPTSSPIRLDGKAIQLTSYNILGNNYVKLRDIGQAVDFNVYWDSAKRCVQVDSQSPYTGTAPATTPASETMVEAEASTVDMEVVRQEIIKQTNEIRTQSGVSALRVEDKLMQAAQVRAEEIAATNTYSHTRPNGSKFYSVTDVEYMSENIDCAPELYLKQQDKPLYQVSMDAWKNSPGHQKNIKNDRLSAFGIGVAKGVDENGLMCYYCVQLFVYDGYTVTWVDDPILQAK